LAKRRDAITGVSEFPNINETLPARPLPDLKTLRAKAGERLSALRRASAAGPALEKVRATQPGDGALTAALIEAASAGATLGALAQALAGQPLRAQPLPRRRTAIEYEALRDASDVHLEKTGKRPQIFLANLGPIAKHTARATFAKNFFEAGGVEALTNDGFADAESCAAGFKSSGARIAILCSADPIYASMVESVAPALKAAGCAYLFLAGAPGDKKDAYLGAGVDDFIFMGGDVLATLRKTHDLLGVTA
jgi:methylmalonyl-CoA mutase